MISTVLFNSIWILPLVAVLVCAPISRKHTALIKRIHLLFAGISLAIASWLVFHTYSLTMPLGIPEGNKPFLQFLTDFEWLPAIHAHYTMATDALGILLVFLTAVIVFTGMLASWKVDKQQKEFFALMQLLGTAVYGVFMSFDLVLFFVF